MLGLPLLPTVEVAVRAEDYDAFWLWNGVAPQPVLARAGTLYILQGQISQSRRRPSEGVRLTAQGVSVPRLTRGEVQMVYRVHILRWTPRVYQAVLNQMQRWRCTGNPVVDIQVDFDAHTRYLDKYVGFLRDLRRRLPREYRLSIAGLLNWGSNVEPAVINRLRGVVNEMMVQTYRGRHNIPNHAACLPRVSRLQLPYRVGLVQGGDWQAPNYLKKSPWFRNYVVFLLNPR